MEIYLVFIIKIKENINHINTLYHLRIINNLDL